jgi:hypothetical protein
MSGSPPLLPYDEALPSASRLLDAQRAGVALPTLLPAAGTIDALRIRYLDYRPGLRLVAHYAIRSSDGPWRDAGVIVEPDTIEAFWYPHDPGLPALGRTDGGAGLVGLLAADVHRLAWVPTARATLRVGDAVIKHYADVDEAAKGPRAMRLVRGVVPTAELVAVDAVHRLVAQRALVGRPLERDDAARGARAATAVLDALARVDIESLARLEPTTMVDQARAPIALASFACPDLVARFDEAMAILDDSRPPVGPLIAAHGDFNVGQLIDVGDHLAVVDLDTLCAAPPAFDVAGYVTNVVSGRAGDVEHANVVRAAMLDAGCVAAGDEHLDWYVAAALARRVDRAVRRLKNDWPERTRRLLEALERAVDRR